MILAGDIGGTKALLALYADTAEPVFEQRAETPQFPGLEALLARFLGAAGTPRVAAACFGLAGPVEDGAARLTNLPWTVDAAALGARFGIPRVRLLNDFAAAAWGLDALGPGDLATLQPGEPLPGAPRVVLGAGTGLGIAYVIDGRPVPGEGGHAAFAPANPRQLELWRYLEQRLGRVELEHVLSGAGLSRIHEFLGGAPCAPEAVSGEALELFAACYGAAAGDFALGVMARGGVYIAGGIAARHLAQLASGGFIAAFNAKGAFAGHARRMPVHVVTNERLALLGAAAAARRAL